MRLAFAQRVVCTSGEMRLDQWFLRLFDSFEQLCQSHLEGSRDGLEHSQANLLVPLLQIRDVVLVHSGFLGEIDLTPASFEAQSSNSFSERNADVLCHPYYRGIVSENTSTLSCGG